MPRVLMVGSARKSAGGVSSVIKLIEKMPVWKKYSCYWLGTQIQRNYAWKLWYAVSRALITPFIIWKYDIVHFHTVPDKICLIIQLPEFLCALFYRKKIIMHIHMGDQLYEHKENKLFKWCLNKSDKIVLLAHRFEKIMECGYGIEKCKTTVVYNACEDMGLIPYKNKEKIILMAGYFDENKSPDILLKAFKCLTDSDIKDWRVIMMGNGNVEKYKRVCHDLELDKYVSFPGYVTGKEKDEIWKKASIFCLCSHFEGFPMVVLEAWNYGIPVICTPVGGLTDIIEEGKNCFTFGFDDVDGLTKQLSKLINNESLREEMSNYEQKFVRDNFSLDIINKELNKLYESL